MKIRLVKTLIPKVVSKHKLSKHHNALNMVLVLIMMKMFAIYFKVASNLTFGELVRNRVHKDV